MKQILDENLSYDLAKLLLEDEEFQNYIKIIKSIENMKPMPKTIYGNENLSGVVWYLMSWYYENGYMPRSNGFSDMILVIPQPESVHKTLDHLDNLNVEDSKKNKEEILCRMFEYWMTCLGEYVKKNATSDSSKIMSSIEFVREQTELVKPLFEEFKKMYHNGEV